MIDMVYGNVFCYVFCLVYMEDKLKKCVNNIGGRVELVMVIEEIVRDGIRFRKSLMKGVFFDIFVFLYGFLEVFEILLEGYNFIDDFK